MAKQTHVPAVPVCTLSTQHEGMGHQLLHQGSDIPFTVREPELR